MGSEEGGEESRETRSVIPGGAMVFDDHLSVTVPDPDHSFEENRFVIVGQSHRGRFLIVSHAERGDRIRLISARELTRMERNVYEERDFD